MLGTRLDAVPTLFHLLLMKIFGIIPTKVEPLRVKLLPYSHIDR